LRAENAINSGVKVAVCSTSSEKAVQTIVDVMLGTDISKVMRVFAGDMVPAKKPDPAIYELAATALGVDPARFAFDDALQLTLACVIACDAT
jgi:beta-phosphoglucomutase-like phosphatase (HAD superfamily)